MALGGQDSTMPKAGSEKPDEVYLAFLGCLKMEEKVACSKDLEPSQAAPWFWFVSPFLYMLYHIDVFCSGYALIFMSNEI